MVVSAVRRLRITRRDVEVVLGGGIMRPGRAVPRPGRDGILAVAPNARISMLQTPPVVGAAAARPRPAGSGDQRARTGTRYADREVVREREGVTWRGSCSTT